jgi:hypothetical protein
MSKVFFGSVAHMKKHKQGGLPNTDSDLLAASTEQESCTIKHTGTVSCRAAAAAAAAAQLSSLWLPPML